MLVTFWVLVTQANTCLKPRVKMHSAGHVICTFYFCMKNIPKKMSLNV